MLAPPSASAISIRRNSAHSNVATACSNITTTTTTTTNTIATVTATPANSLVEPPPVPKRTFLGKILTSSRSSLGDCTSPSATIKMTFNNVCKQTLEEVKRRNGSSSSAKQQTPIHSHQTTRKLVENHYPIDQYSDDDRLSIESSVFEEPKSSDPIMFAASSSNRSSSDSNKSHITIDTGYMSNDTDRIFFGASEDFRSRFSSVDTQSSIDSCTSADMPTQHSFNLQNQARCIISPLAAKRDEYEEKFTSQFSKNFSRMNSASNLLVPLVKTSNANAKANAIAQNNCDTVRRVPAPTTAPTTAAKSQQVMGKIVHAQNALNNCMTSNYSKSRPTPAPPIPTHDSIESGAYGGTSVLGAFQCGLVRITSAAATTSDVVMGRKSFKSQMGAFNQKTTNTRIHQRQDSTDSFSMTSSPGFNTKPSNIDVPQFQHATPKPGSKYNFPGRPAVRHDSTLSSDSVSQTSSPGYNTKLEQPLLAQSIKVHASK